jgi:hypothetical protein
VLPPPPPLPAAVLLPLAGVSLETAACAGGGVEQAPAGCAVVASVGACEPSRRAQAWQPLTATLAPSLLLQACTP